MTVTLVLTGGLEKQLLDAAYAPVESAGVLLARLVRTPSSHIRLLGREIHWVPDHTYTRREALALEITSGGYVPFLAQAENSGTVPIWMHTHPGEGSWPSPSPHDDVVDAALGDLFRLRSGSPFYGTLIVSPAERQLTFTGRIESDADRLDIDRLWVSNSWLSLAHNWLRDGQDPDERFDRNVRAFGGAVQRALGDLTVGIVGSGGTGSAVAEQLVRLGVRHFLLIDPDELSASNVTRVYGSSPDQVGRPKVQVLADHVRRIAPEVDVATYQASIVNQETAVRLLDADVIFGCTDDNAGRLVLSRMASYLLTPVIDCGVLISSDGKTIDGIHGRVTILTPGAACLVCRGRIDLRRAAAETMTDEEHEHLAGEGYAPALGNIEPAVVAFTTQVAAAAVSELLERLIHYGPQPTPSELLLRIHDREQSTTIQSPRERHYCHPDEGKLGLGVTNPFLEQAWQQD